MIRWLRGVGGLLASPYVMLRMFFHVRRQARVLSRPMLMMAFAVVSAMATLPQEVNAACSGTISGVTSFTGATPYNPYSPTDNVATYQLQVTNGAGNCKYALVFRTSSNPAKFGYLLTYTIARGAALSLTQYAQGRMDFTITIDKRQLAAPSSYSDDTIYADIYAADNSGNPIGGKISTKRLDVTYNVEAFMSVNIKGSSSSTFTTMELGTLSKGKQATVEIEARANKHFKLDVTSEHLGALVLTPAVSGQTWSVPYTATLGGKELNLSGQSSTDPHDPTIPGSDATYPLVVTVGETAGKRAGRYEDTITIDIKLAP